MFLRIGRVPPRTSRTKLPYAAQCASCCPSYPLWFALDSLRETTRLFPLHSIRIYDFPTICRRSEQPPQLPRNLPLPFSHPAKPPPPLASATPPSSSGSCAASSPQSKPPADTIASTPPNLRHT